MPVTKETILAFASEPYPGSVRTQHMLMRDLARTSDNVFKEASASTDGNAVDDSSAPKLLDAYKAAIRKNETAKLAFGGVRALVEGTLATATILAAPTGVGAVALAGVNWVVSKQLDFAATAMEKGARREARSILLHQLKKASDAGVDLDSLKEKPSEEVFNILEHASPIFDPALDEVAPEDRELVHGYMLREIEKTVVAGNLQMRDLVERGTEEIKAARAQVARVGNTLVTFAEATGRELGEIKETLTSIQESVDELKESGRSNQRDLRFIQNHLFGQMTVAEQRAALRSGMRSDLSKDERDSLDKQLAVVEKQQQLAAQVQTYLNGAGTIIQIAARLGVNPDIIRSAQQGLTIGQAAFAAGTALASGNFLQAASALSGLLGMGGQDPATQRHEQIVDQLKQISQQIAVLDGKVDEMLALQRQTLSGLKTIYESIVTLSQQISELHQVEMRQIERVRLEVEFVKDLVVQGNGVAQWDAFADSRSSRYFSRQTGEFHSYNRMRSHFASVGVYDYFAPARAALVQLFGFSDEIPSSFEYQAIESSHDLAPNRNLQDWRVRMYEPIIRFILDHLSEVWTEDVQAYLSLFLLPVRRIRALLGTSEIVDVSDALWFSAPMRSYFAKLLAPTTIRTCIQYLVEMFAYRPLIKSLAPVPSLFTLEELLLPEVRGREVDTTILRKALVVAEAAMAQQALLSGHMLLPLFEKCYSIPAISGESEEELQEEQRRKSRVQQLESIIATSPLIRRNWLLYKVLIELKRSGSSLATFHLATNISQDANMLKRVCAFAGFEWKWIAKTDTIAGRWDVQVAGHWEPAPTWKELDSSVHAYTEEMQMLLQVRSQLIAEIANVDFIGGNDLGPEMATSFASSIMRAA